MSKYTEKEFLAKLQSHSHQFYRKCYQRYYIVEAYYEYEVGGWIDDIIKIQRKIAAQVLGEEVDDSVQYSEKETMLKGRASIKQK